MGYGIAIRNMALQPIKVSGRVRIRRVEYPCTLKACCDADFGPIAACCSRNYSRFYNTLPSCSQCGRDASDPDCRPYEESEIPPWSARGPAHATRPASGGTGGWLKPDLVAPGTAVAG
jgi:hypothetical protein